MLQTGFQRLKEYEESDGVLCCDIQLYQYCAVDKIEKNEMGGACGTYGGRERCAQGFGGET